MVSITKIPLYKKSWKNLTPRQRLLRNRSLEVLNKSRKSSQSLSKIAKDFGISIKTVIKNTSAFKKINHKWIPKKYDKISRVMKINENGKEVSIEINDSRKASLIGRYQSNIRRFLENGDKNLLIKFTHKRIKDVKGKFHALETNSKILMQIHDGMEEYEFYEIYGDGN